MAYIYRRDEDIQREPTAPYIFREEAAPKTEIRRYRRDYRPELCGSPKGYHQHRRYKEQPCDRCKAAQAVMSAANRRANKTADIPGFAE